VQARLLAQRGVRTPAEARRFLAPGREQLHDGRGLLGLEAAVARLAEACRRGETVAVVGDYDVDGVTSTALLVAVLASGGARPEPLLSRRHEEGYGLHPVHAERAAELGARVLVAVDCGTNSRAAVDAARELGLDRIVVDHHLPDDGPPIDALLVNPHQPGCSYPFRDLAAAGLALKLAVALLEALGREVPWDSLLRIACLGTIADVAPLTGENRAIAALGLRALGNPRSPGLQALLASAGLKAPLSASDVGFRLGPRLNAPGRLATADVSLELLLARDPARARHLAAELEEWNRRRQALELRVLEEARRMLDGRGELRLGVAWGEGWNRGVVGIAAARLVRELGRPVILLAVDGETATGSGRSARGIDLHRFLSPWSERLERFGGHAMAIGLTARTANLATLEREWAAAAAGWPAETGEREIRYDLDVEPQDLGFSLLGLIEALAPFGAGNEEPLLRTGPLRAGAPPRHFGTGHASLLAIAETPAGEGAASLELIGWGWGSRLDAPPPRFEALVRLERDRWRGGLRGRLEDLRPLPGGAH
jgi:single-stranded-DNA-specific exonuclease